MQMGQEPVSTSQARRMTPTQAIQLAAAKTELPHHRMHLPARKHSHKPPISARAQAVGVYRPATGRRPQQLADFEAAKAAGRPAVAPRHHPNVPAAARLVAQLLAENAALLFAATRAPEITPAPRSRLRKAPAQLGLENRQACPPKRTTHQPTNPPRQLSNASSYPARPQDACAASWQRTSHVRGAWTSEEKSLWEVVSKLAGR